jgi:hypothetical protein
MVNYKCFRCGKDFSQKCHILNHLVRKKPCKSVLKEISNIEILKLNKIEEYNKEKYNILNLSTKPTQNIHKKYTKHTQNNICKYCNKKLCNYNSKWRHEKTCKEKKIILKEKDEIIEKKDQQINELLKLVKELKGNKGNTSIKGNNNMNNTTNNIQINNFDGENIDYFTDKLAFRFAKHYGVMVGKFVKHLHFNENHPENHTIKIKDAKSGIGHILEDGEETSYIMEDFLEKVGDNLKDKLYELNEIVPEERQEEFELLYDEAMEFLEKLKNDKKVKKRIKAACIDGTKKIDV